MGKHKKDKKLLKFATDRQKELIELFWDSGCSYKKAAKKIGVCSSTIYSAIERVRNKASKRGYSPEYKYMHDVPEGYQVSGISTLFDGDGEIVSQWVKSKNIDDKTEESIKLFVDELSENIKGKSKLVTRDKALINDDFYNEMSVFPIGDLHLGMYSWVDETGDDYDCEIAERLMTQSIDKLIAGSSTKDKALIISLGDWFHSDTVDNKTLASGNALDVDTRWQRVFRIGVRIFKYLIESALKKYNKVDVMLINGNHDYHTSYALSLILDSFYDNDSRVNVDLDVNPFRYYKFGKNLIGVTHGMVKESILPGVMASDEPVKWGKTTHRTWFIGHKHQHKVSEYPGCVVEMFGTIASKDAWSNGMGFRSKRELYEIVLHKEHGEIGRSIVNLGMLSEDK